MPRLLLVTTSFAPGAIPNILADLAPHWVDGGWEPTVLTLESIPVSPAAARWKDLGLGLESLELSPRATVSALSKLGKAIRRLAPEMIHTHLGRADVYVPWAKGTLPQVTTFHSVRRNAGKATQWGWKASDGLVAHRTGVSQACIDSFYKDGWLGSPHSVIYNPVNPERLRPSLDRDQIRRQLGWGPSVRLMLAVGRLMPVKGHQDLVTAFASLARDRADLRLVIAGEGPLKATLARQILALGLEGRAVLVGDRSDVANLYAAADLSVFPSYWEGLGLVPLEAWVCGCPVASSRIPAVEEFLDDEENGRFFRPGQPEDLVRVAGAMLDDPEGSRQMAARGAELVQQQVAPARIAAEYAAVYTQVLGG